MDDKKRIHYCSPACRCLPGDYGSDWIVVHNWEETDKYREDCDHWQSYDGPEF